MQIKAFRPDDKTQKKYLEVVRTCANRVNEAGAASNEVGSAGAAAMGEGINGGQGEQNSTINGIFSGNLQTGYFILSRFTLRRLVF